VNEPSAGAAAGLLFGLGLVLVVAWGRARRPMSMVERIGPYVGVPGRASAARDATLGPGAVVRALRGRRSAPVDADLAARLRQAGVGSAPADYRLERLAWATVGAVAGLGLGAVMTTGGSTWAASAVLGATGAVAGWSGRDLHLRRAARRRRRRIEQALPTLADLVALAVSAGASPVQALEGAAAATGGPLADEVDDAVADVRGGEPVDAALRSLAGRTGVRAVQRFVDGIIVALERGTPLTDVVRAQAQDVRADERRRLVETAGRKDVSMLIPVVFLILPTVVLIALFPGVQSLRLVIP